MALLGHKKSRAGCTRCKARRVKCDEAKPCRNCVRRGEHCNLVDELPRTHASAASSYATNGASPNTINAIDALIQQPQLPLPTDWAQDLYLMHHHTRTTSWTYSSREELIEVWQTWVPEAGIKYPFLMHGILATSALHLAHKHPNEALKYLSLFTNHQSLALTGFRSALPNITPENCHAIFAVSMITSISSMSVLSYRKVSTGTQSPSGDGGMDGNCVTLPDVAQHIILTRGVRTVVSSAAEMIMQGPLACFLFGWEGTHPETHSLPPFLHSQFVALHTMVKESGVDPEAQMICEESLNELSNVYLDLIHVGWNERLELGIAWKWVAKIPKDYCSLLIDKCPPALVILVYFALLAKLYKGQWLLDEWYEEIHHAVKSALEPSWWRWLAWPEDQVRNDGPRIEIWRGQTA